MAETTAIQWTDATVNFWWGCTKVGPGCDHCYAEAWDKRTGGAHWGAGAPRRGIKGAEATLCRLNRLRPGARVFLQSMSDIFDNEVPKLWFLHAWDTAHDCRNLRLQIVTKRLPMVERRLAEFAEAFPGRPLWPQHAGLIATVCNQAEADRDVPRLLDLKHRLGIPWVGLSIEPMLGPVDVTSLPWGEPIGNAQTYQDALLARLWMPAGSWTGRGHTVGDRTFVDLCQGLDWIICGGESGPHARPMHPDWARSLRDQCVAAGVAFFFKQWGEYEADQIGPEDARSTSFPPGHVIFRKVGKACAGRKLDGREWNQFPGDAA